MSKKLYSIFLFLLPIYLFTSCGSENIIIPKDGGHIVEGESPTQQLDEDLKPDNNNNETPVENPNSPNISEPTENFGELNIEIKTVEASDGLKMFKRDSINPIEIIEKTTYLNVEVIILDQSKIEIEKKKEKEFYKSSRKLKVGQYFIKAKVYNFNMLSQKEIEIGSSDEEPVEVIKDKIVSKSVPINLNDGKTTEYIVEQPSNNPVVAIPITVEKEEKSDLNVLINLNYAPAITVDTNLIEINKALFKYTFKSGAITIDDTEDGYLCNSISNFPVRNIEALTKDKKLQLEEINENDPTARGHYKVKELSTKEKNSYCTFEIVFSSDSYKNLLNQNYTKLTITFSVTDAQGAKGASTVSLPL